MDKPLDLVVSDILGPFSQDPQGFRYLLTICDHVSTYSIFYPLKSRSDVPAAILDEITHLSFQLGISPKALWMDNSREFVFAALSKRGISFHPLLPYLPQENGEAEHLNRTLGDMARAIFSESSMPDHFWQFAYASACYLHNRLPNRWCPYSSPHQGLYGRPPSIATLYLFRERAIMHVPAVQQPNKLAERGIECRLLKPLLASGGGQPNDSFSKCDLPTLSNGLLGQGLSQTRAQHNVAWPAKDISVPESLRKALVGPHQHFWEQACLDELDQMKRQGVWQAIDRTPEIKTIGHCWVFNTKLDEYGNIEKLKARLVAHGD
ncbi:hypothetical protein O181_002212 [Austropuccinia psidii MF-1]|uniref:Integrase catalytic domain-containing protein n=1 Tax=Austropuccinia psidii MF-1 TaxID=1389203 RepID=A0A9Q3BCD6_9BASI|nr:hypothetical protein [Austropuccinia psidii MF-1]